MARESSGRSKGAWVAAVAAVISTLAALASVWISAASWNPWGRVEPIEPSSYAIVRGMPDRSPTDYLILPLEWKNDSGGTQLVRKPSLTLSVLKNGKPTGEEQVFLMVGKYHETSIGAFSEPYSVTNTFVIEAHSIASNVVVFAPRRWWDPDDPDHEFRFHSGNVYQVKIEYLRNSDDEPSSRTLLNRLPIYGSADQLVLYGKDGPWWDSWYL